MKMLDTFMLLFFVVQGIPVHANENSYTLERKAIANAEYDTCMSIAKERGVPAAIQYIMENQKESSLISTPTTLAAENCLSDSMGFSRYETLDDIRDNHGNILFPIDSPLINIADNLPKERRVARLWVREYLIELAEGINRQAGITNVDEPLITLTSLVRSRTDQDNITKIKKYWLRVKGHLRHYFTRRKSIADCTSEAVCSTHLTGSTVDILIPKSSFIKKLLEERLLKDRAKGRILVILEKKGNHFHVFVLPFKYVETSLKKNNYV